MSFVPSKYQQDIFDWAGAPEGNRVVKALAGSGKTTTGVQMLRVPGMSERSVQYLAYNKRIADAIRPQIPIYAEANTLNSFGFRILRQHGSPEMNVNKTELMLRKAMGISPDQDIRDLSYGEKNVYYECRTPMSKVISSLKNAGYLKKEVADDTLRTICETYDIDEPEVKLQGFYWFDMVRQVWQNSLEEHQIIDFDDQLFFPIYLDLPIPKSDFVVVDESQDLNAVQVELTIRAVGGHLLSIGDPNQAIYAFRGALPHAIQRIVDAFGAKEMCLPICYRCPRAVITEAQRFVPEMECPSWAADGLVDHMKIGSLEPMLTEDDTVLCRTTHPLVRQCLRLLAKNRPANILGNDLGKGLATLIRKLRLPNNADIGTVEETLDAYETKETNRLKEHRRHHQITLLRDKAACIKAVAEQAADLPDLLHRIGTLFDDTRRGVLFCTIHKAKGLEFDRVFIIRPDLLPHPLAKSAEAKRQERNLQYVGITRTKKELRYVHDPEAEAKTRQWVARLEEKEKKKEAEKAGVSDE
jgi:DNA helicase-2/ATP-dependent DNA helicase PcrA